MLAPGWVSTLATAGGLVFSGDDEGDFFALDADTGKLLWSFPMSGVDPRDSPVTYSIGGKEYVVISSINIYAAFGLP
jgi:alcohol dehydrogenase (cytochrome c)